MSRLPAIASTRCNSLNSGDINQQELAACSHSAQAASFELRYMARLSSRARLALFGAEGRFTTPPMLREIAQQIARFVFVGKYNRYRSHVCGEIVVREIVVEMLLYTVAASGSEGTGRQGPKSAEVRRPGRARSGSLPPKDSADERFHPPFAVLH